MANDIAERSAQVLANIETHSNVPKVAPHLIKLIDRASKTPKELFFVSVSAVSKDPLVVTVKGVYTKDTEEKIAENPYEYVKQVNKEDIVEMQFPWHNIISIRNLIYKAK